MNWEIRPGADIEAFFTHCRELLATCQGAELVVFPELPCLEMLGRDALDDQGAAVRGLAKVFEPYWHRFGELAARHNCTWIAGTYFVERSGTILNCAVVALPDGRVTTDVPKVVMTQFEIEDWTVAPGTGLRCLPDPRIGVTVCYDCEFPESGRALAETGVLVQGVPAFTETAQGFWRVRHSCHARSVENQIFVVHASLVGGLGHEPVPSAHGSSAIIAPPVGAFPENGVLAETLFDREGVALAELDLKGLLQERGRGDVRNWEDRRRGDWSVGPAIWTE